MSLDKEKLSNVLEQLFTHMEEQGLHLEPVKDQLKQHLMNDLKNNELAYEDLDNKEVKKKLFGCITELLINGKTDEYNNLIGSLESRNDNVKHAQDEKFDNKLLAQLLFLTALTKLNDQKIKQEMVLTPEAFKKNLKDHIDKNIPKYKTGQADELKNEFDFLMRAFYGVGKAGELGVLFEPGNQAGIPNITRPDPNSVAFMVDANTYNSKTDYLGLENAVKVNDLSEGINLDPHVSPKLGPPA